MTVVITPVGTSLFTNGGKENTTISNLFADIEDLDGDQWNLYPTAINLLRTESVDFINEKQESAAAELQSSMAIRSQQGHNITVRLLASDTVASRLAAEILQSSAAAVLGPQCTFEFNPDTDVIQGLQVLYPMQFRNDGIPNLKDRLNTIYYNTSENEINLAINITAGYGAFVPPMMLFSQGIGGIPLYYHFKDSHMVLDLSKI